MKRPGILSVLLLLALTATRAQQVGDTDFHFENPNPAYANGEGPQVCIDEAHFNFHTADGRYKPFAELLGGDGYRVSGFAYQFTREALTDCGVLVIANAVAAENQEGWSYPHPSAFSRAEINELVEWIRGGGSLLLIADHAPWPGAAADLGAVLGVHMLDGYAHHKATPDGPDFFFRAGGTLALHPIANGRSPEEQVESVVTFGGQAFYPSGKVQPLLVFGPQATAVTAVWENFPDTPENDAPRFRVAGWLQGAARQLGQGRVVILGEAAMCTAQVSGPERRPMGMNHPKAPQNAQFCLNVVRWLSGLLD